MYNLIIKNGRIVDPQQNVENVMDIAISEGKIVAIQDNIDTSNSEKIMDVSGKIVTPGLIDLHTHVYWGGTSLGIDPDYHCLQKGTTTVLDAGTSGSRNFVGFRKFIIEKAKTRIIPLLNISSMGLLKPPELEDIRFLEYDDAVSVAKANSDLVKGFKIRFASPPNNHVGKNGPQAMRLTREATDDVNGMIMVHPKSMTPDYPLEEILKLLKSGDVVTHCFSPKYDLYFPHTEILDEDFKVKKEVKEAAERGVIFDIGHGRGSFSFNTAKNALKDGFLPTTISTDLHSASVESAKDMPTVMSKFLALGVSLSKVVELSTTNPAKVIGLEGILGTLKLGGIADITILDLIKGDFTFNDVRGNQIKGDKLLKPFKVIKDGKIID